MNNILGNNIRHLRRAALLTQDQIAERLGYKSFTTVQSWETGRTTPPAKTVNELASLFGVSMDDLVNQDLSSHGLMPFRPAVDKHDPIRIPVLGKVPAGIPLEAIEEVIDYEELSSKNYGFDKQYFGLLVQGESMAPTYQDGDVIIVEVNDTCDSGDDCVVMVNQHDATLKRVYKYENGSVELRPLNPAFNRVTYNLREVEELPILICGVIKEIRRRV